MVARFLQRRARMPLRELINKWVFYIESRYTPRTVIHYKMVIRRFADSMPADIKDITVEHLERYISDITRTYANATANAHLGPIKSFYRTMAQWHGINNIAEKVKTLVQIPPQPRVIIQEEYEKILEVCSPQEKDIIEFIAHTGIRKSELQSLRWNNVSHDMRFLTLLGKGRRQRIVPLNQTCKNVLSKYPRKPNAPIQFLKSYHAQASLWMLCQRLAKRADIPRFGPHALRHYMATRMMQLGVPIAKISRILGHQSVSTTEKIYIHWLPQDLLGTTDVLDG